MIRRRSWAKISGERARRGVVRHGAGSSARSAAAGRRTRAQRTNDPHSRAHDTLRDISRHTTDDPPLVANRYPRHP